MTRNLCDGRPCRMHSRVRRELLSRWPSACAILPSFSSQRFVMRQRILHPTCMLAPPCSRLPMPEALPTFTSILHICEILSSKMRHAVSYTHLRAHETVLDLVCRLLLE